MIELDKNKHSLKDFSGLLMGQTVILAVQTGEPHLDKDCGPKILFVCLWLLSRAGNAGQRCARTKVFWTSSAVCINPTLQNARSPAARNAKIHRPATARQLHRNNAILGLNS